MFVLIVVSVLAQRVLTSEMYDVTPLSCPYTSPNHGEHVVELVHPNHGEHVVELVHSLISLSLIHI